MRVLQIFFGLRHLLIRKIWMGLTLPKEFLVLDLGSGDKPFWRANVFVDDLNVRDSERSGKQPAHKFGVFVDANAEELPFRDCSFDFVYCSHLIEHVENPDKVLREIIRVTKPGGGGYIECPSAIVESIAPFAGHRWLIFETIKHELKFFRQSTGQHFAAMESGKTRSHLTGMFNWNGYSLFIQYFWRKKNGIDFSINDYLSPEQKYQNRETETVYAGPGKFTFSHKQLVSLLRKLFKINVPHAALDQLLKHLESLREYQCFFEEGEERIFVRHPSSSDLIEREGGL